MGDKVQFRQEMGGLTGRILLAVLLLTGFRPGLLLDYLNPVFAYLPR